MSAAARRPSEGPGVGGIAQDVGEGRGVWGTPVRIGVLALQGAFREHRLALERVGAHVTEIRRPAQLERLDGLIIPGGESTTIGKLLRAYGLDEAIQGFAASGGALWGTCAGAIAVASVIEGQPEQPRLGLLGLHVARNGYGRQVASFEADVRVEGWDDPFRAVFIRAPRIIGVGAGVRVLAVYDDEPVAVGDETTLATVFHPELTGDDRWHRAFVERCLAARAKRYASASTETRSA